MNEIALLFKDIIIVIFTNYTIVIYANLRKLLYLCKKHKFGDTKYD